MIYYLPAVLAALMLCSCKSVALPLPGGAQAICFSNGRKAFWALLPLTLLALFRWDVGVDSVYGSSYWEAYQLAKMGVNSRDFEWGFYQLLRLFSRCAVPFYWFLFAHGLLFMLLCSRAMARGSVWTRWSILVFFLLFFYFDCYSSLRQSLAEAICLMAWANMGYDAPSKRKDVRIVLLFALSGLCHKIGWMNIPVYLLCRVRLSRQGMLKILLAAIVISPLLQAALRFAMALFAGSSYEFQGVALINAVMTGAIALVCWYFYDDISRLDENAYMYVNQALCIFVLILNSGAMYLPFRVFDMLKIGYVFIIPYFLRGIKSARLRLLAQIVLLLVLGAWFCNQFFLQDCFAVSYQTVFQDWNNIIHLP